MLVGMRLHSLVFAHVQGVASVGMYATAKVASFLDDIGNVKYRYKLPVDSRFRPTHIDSELLAELLLKRLDDPTPAPRF